VADTPCIIGEGIQIRGNLSGSGDLIIRGRVEGFVELQDHLTVAETGTVVASIDTRGVTLNGKSNGDIHASETVTIAETAVVIGDIHAPEIEIADGARFRGRLEMEVPLPDDI
jgi:cytoskeletal protein CcmA (bactofilin family)